MGWGAGDDEGQQAVSLPVNDIGLSPVVVQQECKRTGEAGLVNALSTGRASERLNREWLAFEKVASVIRDNGWSSIQSVGQAKVKSLVDGLMAHPSRGARVI